MTRIAKGTLLTALLLLLGAMLFAAGQKEGAAGDTSKKVRIEIMQGVWTGTPLGDDDPYKKWLDQTYNADFVLNNVANFSEQIMVRFASKDVPDVVSNYDKNLLINLWNEGVLVGDWNKYMGTVPTVFKGMTDNAKVALTYGGKLALLATPGEPAIWSWKVRKDWLAKMNLQMPKTPDELLALARKFTLNDPDGNGKNDTYAFTSAGGKAGVGEISNLVSMWGPSTFYITADGKVSNPIVDGNWEKFLGFLRTVVKEQLIDPDWYTISWNDRKPKLFAGTYGTCYYPGVLANECENGTGNTGATVGWWQTMPTPQGSATGGKIAAGGLWGILRTVSAATEKDPVKLPRVLKFIEDTAYPNDGFWKLRWGVGIDGFMLKDAGDGWKFMNVTGKPGVNKRGYYKGGNLGLYDWGYSVSTRGDLLIEGSTDELVGATKAELDMNKASRMLPTFGSEAALLTLDAKVLEDLGRLQAEFDYKYATGEDSNYANFKAAWLAAGGQKLLDDAAAQFKQLGLIK